jgi:cytochrome c oxidase cbb3-type subunit 3
MNSDDKNNSDEHLENITDHDYDGIKELDNPPPRWIMAIFYITIGIAIIYGAYYFWLGVGDHQDAEYVKQNERHEAKFQLANQSSEDLILLSNANELEEGKTIYKEMNCFVCHGQNGEGNAIGPNLTDSYWLNGCSFNEVFSIIKNGNPSKGMTAFKGQLSDSKIQKVSSYILTTFKGSNPASGKEAQGEICE